MGSQTVDDDYRGVKRDEIRWTSEPVELLDKIDLLVLDDDELMELARNVQSDNRALRELAREAMHRVALVTARAVEEIIRLEDERIPPRLDLDERHADHVRRVMRIRAKLHASRPCRRQAAA